MPVIRIPRRGRKIGQCDLNMAHDIQRLELAAFDHETMEIVVNLKVYNQQVISPFEFLIWADVALSVN